MAMVLSILSKFISLSLNIGAFDFDPFEKHLRRYINLSMSPCENFYRHVCPQQFDDNDSIMTMIEKELKQTASIGARLLPMPKRSQFSALIDNFGKQFPPDQQEILHNVNIFYKGLYYHSAILIVLSSDDEELNIGRFRNVVADINATLFSEIQRMKSWMQFQRFFLPLEDENILDVNRYKAFIAMFNSNYQQFLEHNSIPEFTARNILRRKSEFTIAINDSVMPFIDSIKLFSPNLYTRIKNSFLWNAENSFKRFITVQESIILPVAHKSIPEAAVVSFVVKFGSFGFVFAHELIHSFIKTEEIGKDKAFDSKVNCQMRHFQRSCSKFGETSNCSSGQRSFIEDSADLEGIQLAYKAFSKKYRNTQKLIAYSGLGINMEQLFFYSTAITLCRGFHETQTVIDGHSPPAVRINGVMSQMKSFQRAFNCHNTNNMVAPERCHYFGVEA